MLLLLFLPPFVSLLLWLGLGFVFWDPFLQFAQDLASRFLVSYEIPSWLTTWFSFSNESVATVLAGVMAAIILLPMIFLTSLLITSVVVMPRAISYVRRSFPNVEMRGQGALRASFANLFRSSVIYLVLWFLSLPLWMTGVGFAIPLFLNGYLNYRLFAFDALVDIASPTELRVIMRKKRIDYLLLGVLTAALVLVPPLFLILPIYTALCFTRYSFLTIQERRRLTDRVTSN
jgi:CysZ protein